MLSDLDDGLKGTKNITDDWDRRTNKTYLELLIRKEIMNNM